MRLRVTFALFALVCSVPEAVAAQPTPDDSNSYQRLRQRLRTRFMVVGDGIGDSPGESMPAHVRSDAEGYVRWADATIDLGWYIGVLATEHHLADRLPGADVARTERELVRALGAMERLDRAGDAFFPAPCSSSPDLNGFFIRDDVPAGFHRSFGGMSQTRSDSLSASTLNEMSQDQVYHVLLGLSLVKALMPDDVRVEGRRLREIAIAQGTRILRHVAARSDWVIRNPACGGRPVARGEAAAPYSRGVVAVSDWLTDGAFVPEENLLGSLWDLARDPDSAFYDNVDNLHMSMAIAAIGNGFGDETLGVLVDLAGREGWHVYPLLQRVLHGASGSPQWCAHGEATTRAAGRMLRELPPDAEPRSPRPGGPASHVFTTSNRFIRGADQAYVGAVGSAGEQYHGLDFMLLHNLLAIATEEPVPACDHRPAPDGGTAPPDAGGDDGGYPDDAAMTPDARGPVPPPTGMSGGCTVGIPTSSPAGLLLAAVAILARRRRRRLQST